MEATTTKSSTPQPPKPSGGEEADFWRQLDLFAPSNFKKSVTVIGVGATGSYIAYLLAKMGCRDISVFDHDEIENHNLPNQIFGLNDMGVKKVEALQRRIFTDCGIVIKPHAKLFERGELSGIVFVCTDTMKSRAQIWHESVKYKLGVDLMIEMRMAAEGGQIYAIKPSMPRQIAAYEKTLFKDEEAEESPCSRRAIAPTVATVAGMSVFTLINYVNSKPFYNEVTISLMPPILISKNF
jgi:molybdopterin/thiamine biosynthesis adenylyltransferase